MKEIVDLDSRLISSRKRTDLKSPIRGHVVELRPTASQAEYLDQCAGTMRYTYNSLVAKWKMGDKYNRKVFQKHCSMMRQSTPWMQKVSSRATYEAADNFHTAVINFFKSCKGERKGKKMCGPDFKKKSKNRDALRFSHSTQFSISGRNLKIQGLKEKIRMRERVRFNGNVKNISIKLHAGKWFASFAVELNETPPSKIMTMRKPSVGVDFGIKVLAALSTGDVIENPKPLRKKLRLLQRRQRQISRKFVEGRKQSKRYQIAKMRVAKLHKKIADQRSAAQHKFTSDLVTRFDRIIIEDLDVSNLLKNKKLSRAISDASWGSLRWRLTYKAEEVGVEIVVADRFFASSKTCSCCGYKLEKMTLKMRTFICPLCHFSADRDLNAAINLDSYTPSQKTPPNKGSRKTRTIDFSKPTSREVAGSLDGANINLQPRVSTETYL